MNKLSRKERAQVVAALVEGTSIRAICRRTGVAKGTVLKRLADLGKACLAYHDRTLRGLSCKRIQCDDIWSFCYAKEKNLPEELKGKLGFGELLNPCHVKMSHGFPPGLCACLPDPSLSPIS